jgi:hypothetical protein
MKNIWKSLQSINGWAPMRYVPLPSQYFKILFLFLQKIKKPWFDIYVCLVKTMVEIKIKKK